MALPVILVNATGGSDTTASGAGPSVALSGTTNASTDPTGLIVTLPAGTDLTNVAIDGSHVIFLNDSTAGARNFGKIVNSAGSGGATPTVTVADAFGLNLTTKSWAIGGVRASIAGTTSSKLFTQGGGTAGDAMPGWAVEMQSAHAESSGAFPQFRRGGDQTSGEIILRGTSGAATMPIVTLTNNGTGLSFVANILSFTVRDFELRNSNATKTASVAIQLGNNNAGILITGMKIADATNKFWKGILTNGSALGGVQILRNNIGSTASDGIGVNNSLARLLTIRGNRIHDCGGAAINIAVGVNSISLNIRGNEILTNAGGGIVRDTGTGIVQALVIDGNTIKGNTGDAINLGSPATTLASYAGTVVTNNILANNTANGLNLSGTGMTAAAWNSAGTLTAGNQTFGNGAACNLAGVLTGDSTADPQFTGSTDLRVGANMKGAGYPADNNPGQAYRSYVTAGANESATPPTGGVVGGGGMTGGFNG